jgi:anaerobic selenocysteine-containing dehydrogenase
LLKYITGWGQELLAPEQAEKKLGSRLPVYKMGVAAASINEIIPAMLEQSEDYPIKAAWIQTVNEIACGGVDIKDTIKAFNNLEFNVVVDMFMTPTIMAFGDLVLPVTVYPERNGIRCGDGHQRAETINQAIEPLGECKSDQEINLELGRRFNPEAWPWANVEEMYSFILKETGLSFEQVQDVAPAYLPFEYEKYQTGKLRPDGALGFPTPTGRIELYSNIYAFMGYNPVPAYVEPPMTPVSQPELYKEYPLVLTTGARRHNTFHSENRQSAHLRQMHPEPSVQIHPQAAAELGLAEGQWVWVEGPVGLTGKVGRAKRQVEITPIVDPRVVSTDHAWWHPEGDPEQLFDVMELNINNLISWSSGNTGVGANYKCILCKIYKVEE